MKTDKILDNVATDIQSEKGKPLTETLTSGIIEELTPTKVESPAI